MSSNNTKEKILDKILKNLNMDEIVTSALMSALTDEARDKLVEGIMSYLSSSTGGYSSKTVIQEAFNNAIRSTIQEKMHEIVSKDDAVMNEIEKCVAEATQKFIGMDKEELIKKLTSTMSDSFTRERY